MEGTTLSHFRLLEKIGEGGMGVIYRAEDLNLGRTVALKVLPPQLVADEERRHRFIEEARTAATVTHPHIATIHEVDEADGTTFIAMELVEGESLRNHMGGHSLPIKEAVRIGSEIAEAMGAAHLARIIHRDLKPDNVMIGKDGHVRVLDFGLAQLLESRSAPVADGQTKTMPDDSSISGTPAYMSPEQARGKPLDARTDIFSFGCTLYEMLTGAPPFKGASASDTISQLLNREPAPAATLNPDVPDGLQWILDKCLDKDPSQRYQDARDLAVDLRHIAADSGSQATAAARAARTGAFPAAGAPTPLWKQPVVLAGAVLVVAAAAFGLPRLFQGGGVPVSPASANSIAVFSFENLKDPEDPERLGQILQELVITDLSGLEPVKVLSSQRLHDVQKQVGIKEAKLDKDRTTEVAVRAGAGRMLTGTLSQLGEKWILSAQLVDVKTGEVVGSKRIDGDDLYTMVDMLTAEIQSDLRIAVPVEAEAVPVKDRTTHSLEAYKHYLAGVEHLNNELFDLAEAELRKAVEIDPHFGQAYYKLAVAVWWPRDEIRAAREPIQTLLSRKLYSSERERRMAEGMLSLIQHKYGEARETYEQLTQDYPDEKEAWYGLGESLFHAFGGGKEEEAIAAFRRALALDPEFRLPYQHIFDTYLRRRMPEEAVAEAEKLLEMDASDPAWNRFQAMAVAMQGDEKATEAALRQALVYNTAPEEKKRLYQALAEAARSRGDVEGRLGRLKQAAAAAPEDALLQRRVADAFYAERRLEDYDRAILEGLARFPDSYAFQAAARGVWRRNWEWGKAAAMAESLAAVFPDDPTAARDWVGYAVQMGDETKAARAMAHAERLHRSPDERRALYDELADAAEDMEDQVRQLEFRQKIVDLTPETDADACTEMAGVTFALGRIEEARTWIARGAAGNPRHGGVLAGQVLLAGIDGDVEAAREYVDQIGKLAPGSSFYYSFRAVAAILGGNTKELEALDREAMKVLTTPNERYDYLTGVRSWFLMHRDLKLEEASLRKAVAIDPAPEALSSLAVTLALEGDLDGARRELDRGLARSPGNHALLRSRCFVEVLEGRMQDAESTARHLVETPPVRSWKYWSLGLVYAAQDRQAEALPWLEKAAAMNPDRFVLSNLARTLVAGNLDLDRGVEVATDALELDPPPVGLPATIAIYPPPEESLGLAALRRKQYGEAVGWLEKAAAANPNRPSIRKALEEARSGATGAP